jgi:hypothetical protein
LETLQWSGTSHLLPVGCQTGGEEVGRGEEEEEEEEAERDMESSVSFIQANVQHSIAAAARILTGTVSFKGTDMHRDRKVSNPIANQSKVIMDEGRGGCGRSERQKNGQPNEHFNL